MICQRCAKDVPNIHTCSPSDLVRKLEAEVASAIAYNRNLQDAIEAYRAEVAELRKDAESAFTLLATMFDAYEDGDECYEDPEDRAGYCGKAIKLDEADFGAIVNLLNKHRPRTAIDAALAKDSSHE